jgi:hypothetical protein
MLTSRSEKPAAIQARLRRKLRRHWDRPSLPTALGCTVCPQYEECGGLHTERRQFDCLGQCCGKPDSCTKVCRRNVARYTQQVREIGGFELSKTPRAPALLAPTLPPFVAMLYHRGRRSNLFSDSVVALSLYSLFYKQAGRSKFASRADLCAAFGISAEAQIVLTGTDQDPPLERWWRYGEDRRRQAIRDLRLLGISLVTTPNYSLFANLPRWDDLHSMKRIAIVQAEFASGGVPCALHVNGRTEKDFHRWGRFLADRPEITHIAYEFGTGAGRPERLSQHLAWLADVAHIASRPLTLVVRGGLQALPFLAGIFADVVFIDTDVFMKTMNRQGVVRSGNSGIEWCSMPTAHGDFLDDLFERNSEERRSLVQTLLAPQFLVAAE